MFKPLRWYNSPDIERFLLDPLRETTRHERTSLLKAATVGVLFAHTGLVPKEISVLGIQLSEEQQIAWWVILALIVAYFMVAFGLYCLTDYVSWRRDARADLMRKARAELSPRPPLAERPPLGTNAAVLEKVGDMFKTPLHIESRLWRTRCFFDMVLPIALAAYSIVALSWRGLTVS
jgi:hypothetical protein